MFNNDVPVIEVDFTTLDGRAVRAQMLYLLKTRAKGGLVYFTTMKSRSETEYWWPHEQSEILDRLENRFQDFSIIELRTEGEVPTDYLVDSRVWLTAVNSPGLKRPKQYTA